MARRAIMSFQALSLNAPKNWAMRSPRRALEEVPFFGESERVSDMSGMENVCRGVGRRHHHEEWLDISMFSTF
jgi:hypothetical protein